MPIDGSKSVNPSTTSTKRTPRWKAAYDQLVAELPRHAYGSPFYTRQEIAQKFAVSDITARRVLNELATDGFIQKHRPPRRAVVVRPQQRVTAYLLEPAGQVQAYPDRSVVHRRVMAGVNSCAESHAIEIGSISEGYLHQMFPRDDAGGSGFLLPNRIEAQTIEFLQQHQLPYVMLDPLRRPRRGPYARVSRFHVGHQSTRYLLGLGHRRIAYVLGAVTRAHFRDRVRGYRAALKEAHVPFDWDLLHETDSNTFPAADALESLLRLKSPPTAVIAGDDYRAIELLEACQQHGLTVPAGMSLLGYPNHTESKLTTPPLTVFDAGYERVGKAALKLLLDQILQGTPPEQQRVTIKPKLVERRSTAAAPHGASQADRQT